MWLFAINLTALRAGTDGPWRHLVGLLLAVLYALNILFAAAPAMPKGLVETEGALVAVVAPVWFIWTGLRAWRHTSPATSGRLQPEPS